MKAVVIDEPGGVEKFRAADIPTPKPHTHEVRIQIKALGFNPVDTKMRQGVYPNAKYPLVLGADCAGVIDAVGEGVQDFHVGDEVLAFVFGQGSNGTYAEYTCIHTHFVAKKPPQLSFEEAASLPLVGLTAARAIFPAPFKDKAVFIAGGSGGVGSMALQLAMLQQAGPIFTTAGSEKSAAYLTDTLKVKKENILFYAGLSLEEMKRELIEKNRGKLLPFCFDFVGKEMKKLCFACVDFQGHVSTILPEQKGYPFDVWNRGESIAFEKSLTIHFVYVGSESFGGPADSWALYHKQLVQLTQLVAQKRMILPAIQVLEGLSAEKIQEAHRALETGHTKGKLVLKT